MLGLPLKFILAPGQSSEIKYAPELIKDIENADILGDKAFNCDEFIIKTWQSEPDRFIINPNHHTLGLNT